MADAWGTGGAPSPVNALDQRLNQAGLIAPQTSSLAVRTGVMIAPGATALVTGTSATGTMTVSIAAHHWITTRGTADGVYIGTLEAATTVNIAAAPGANSRIDVVYVKQNDTSASTSVSPDGSQVPVYGVATGTAAVSPTKPAIPTGAIELATVTVAVGATSTNGAGVTISNTARLTVARGADIPVRSQAERDALTPFYPLQTVKRLDTGRIEMRNAANSAWLTVYDPAPAAPQAVGGLLHKSGNQAVGTGTISQVVLNVTQRAVGMSVASGGFTATTAGIYLVSGGVGFAANTTGRRLAQIYLNGVAIPQTLHTSTSGAGIWRVPTATYPVQMAAGDNIQLYGLQESTVTIDFVASECFMQATYLGAA